MSFARNACLSALLVSSAYIFLFGTFLELNLEQLRNMRQIIILIALRIKIKKIEIIFSHRNEEVERKIMYLDAIAKVIAERTGRDVSAIKPESTFKDLGIDSLDAVEVIMSLEDEIGVEIELDQKVETVDELDKFIQSKVNG